ncbi:MAG: hypothetical protein AMJ72_02675 [Acidithiobacillales bacterium SM1_46]|nr:MAG: hypothetical protein AMJ72_02675 [Acidithiobacillales bacterium SM1_46]
MNLEQLAEAWLDAKADERRANAERRAIEDQILSQLNSTKEEGRSTTKLQSGFKIVTTGKLSYKAEIEAIIETTEGWPSHLKPYKTKVELDETKLKELRETRPDVWRKLASVVTVKPLKTQVTIERMESEDGV